MGGALRGGSGRRRTRLRDEIHAGRLALGPAPRTRCARVVGHAAVTEIAPAPRAASAAPMSGTRARRRRPHQGPRLRVRYDASERICPPTSTSSRTRAATRRAAGRTRCSSRAGAAGRSSSDVPTTRRSRPRRRHRMAFKRPTSSPLVTNSDMLTARTNGAWEPVRAAIIMLCGSRIFSAFPARLGLGTDETLARGPDGTRLRGVHAADVAARVSHSDSGRRCCVSRALRQERLPAEGCRSTCFL